MLNKIVKKLLVFLLCFACAMPFLGAPISFAYANKNYEEEANGEYTVFIGTEFKYEIESFKDELISFNDIVIYGNEGDSEDFDDTKIIFKKGKDDNSQDSYVVSFTMDGNILSITFTKTGTFKIKIQEKASEPEFDEIYTFNVCQDISEIKLNYIANDENETESKYKKYKDNIDTAVNGTDNESKLILGKSFEVPSVENLIVTQISYNNLNKQVYYSTPGSSTYSSTSALSGTPKFKVSEYGTYVYYVLLSSDNLTDNKKDSVKITVDYLKEELDGFYKYTIKDSGEDAYYSTKSQEFYATKEEADEGEGTAIIDENVEKASLIVPKFTFTLESEGPVIEITSSYQENGHIGASYKISSINVSGSESTTYTLYYKESLNATPVDVTTREEENFDATNLTFTPSKNGWYYVEVSAVDSIGKKNKAKTADINVVDVFENVPYKVGFADWLEKNTLPFVLLCVSGACLIAIICLLFIKPKDPTTVNATKKGKMVDEKDVDR